MTERPARRFLAVDALASVTGIRPSRASRWRLLGARLQDAADGRATTRRHLHQASLTIIGPTTPGVTALVAAL